MITDLDPGGQITTGTDPAGSGSYLNIFATYEKIMLPSWYRTVKSVLPFKIKQFRAHVMAVLLGPQAAPMFQNI